VNLRRLSCLVILRLRSPLRRRHDGRRFLHHHESRAVQILRQPFGNDPRHQLIGVMLTLTPVKTQREGERFSKFVGRRGREAIGSIGHDATVTQRSEQNKNALPFPAKWLPREQRHVSNAEQNMLTVSAGLATTESNQWKGC